MKKRSSVAAGPLTCDADAAASRRHSAGCVVAVSTLLALAAVAALWIVAHVRISALLAASSAAPEAAADHPSHHPLWLAEVARAMGSVTAAGTEGATPPDVPTHPPPPPRPPPPPALERIPEGLGVHLPEEYPQYHRNETLLTQLVQACARREETFMWVGHAGEMVVTETAPLGDCPPLDIMLHGEHRGIGMCTDVVLYVLHVGARLLPKVNASAYPCGPQTARLFLETIYPDWLSDAPRTRNIMLPNFENFYRDQAPLHARMTAFLCKHAACERLLRAHAVGNNWTAPVVLMGHTSVDPSVGAEFAQKTYDSLLHVKGKSPHKYTQQLLECYSKHREFRSMVVVGQLTFKEAAIRAPNIRTIPPKQRGVDVTNMGNASIGKELITFEELRDLQTHSGIHVCVSEREGFGHYINEARAVGALVVTTAHPPMNELVTKETGMLVIPHATKSYGFQALNDHGNINAIIHPWNICPVLMQVHNMSETELRDKGRAARAAYLRDKSVFLGRLDQLKVDLYRAWLQEAKRSGTPLHKQTIPGPAFPGRPPFMLADAQHTRWHWMRRSGAASALEVIRGVAPPTPTTGKPTKWGGALAGHSGGAAGKAAAGKGKAAALGSKAAQA